MLGMSVPVQHELTDDINCIDCGYNLRGLDPVGRCPECNAEVSRSLHGDLLRFANPRWLTRVILGVLLFFWSFAVNVVAAGVVPLFARATDPMAAMAVVRFATVALLVLAAFYVTTQEPRTTPDPGMAVWRRAVRAAAVVQLLLPVIFGVIRVSDPVLVTLSSLLGSVAAVVLIFGIFSAIQSLLSRIPDTRLAWKASMVKWGLCGFALVTPAFRYLVLRYLPTARTGGALEVSESMMRTFKYGSCFIGVAYIGLAILASWVLWQSRIELAATLTQAKAWAVRETGQES